MMDRDSFPTLLESATGWPLLHVPWGQTGNVTIEVSEDTEVGSTPVINILTSTGDDVFIFYNGKHVALPQ
jgi:hypothetical protein